MGVGFDKATGRLVVSGNIMEEVEIQEAEPKILGGCLEPRADGDVTEREINGQALPIRAFIISRALRQKLYDPERIQAHRKGTARLAVSLLSLGRPFGRCANT